VTNLVELSADEGFDFGNKTNFGLSKSIWRSSCHRHIWATCDPSVHPLIRQDTSRNVRAVVRLEAASTLDGVEKVSSVVQLGGRLL